MSNSRNGKLSKLAANQRGVVEETAEFHSGPMPHPSIVAGYEDTYPGAAAIIFKSFQDQTAHRIEIEKKVIETGAKKEMLGIWFGFIIAIVAILGGIYAALQDKVFLGGAVTFAGLGLLVGAFIYNKRPESKD